MDEILETLTHTAGIDASLLVSRDGLVISQAGRLDGMEVELLGATSSEMYASAESLLKERSARGGVETLMFEGSDGHFLMNAVNDDVFLLVLSRKKANLGLLRHETREGAVKLKDVM